MQYKIIEAYNIEDMQVLVNKHIKNGFSVLGGCQVTTLNFYGNRLLYIQTVIKTDDYYSHTFQVSANDYKVIIDPVKMT